MIIAYLMKAEKMTLKDAYDHVRQCRPSIAPVPEYLKQLQEYEKSLLGKISMELESANNSVSLTQRITEWREAKRKNGSMPADLASSRGSSDGTEESDSATRAHTAPNVGSPQTNARPLPIGSQQSNHSDLSGSVEDTATLEKK